MTTGNPIVDRVGGAIEQVMQEAANRTGRSYTLSGAAVVGEKRITPVMGDERSTVDPDTGEIIERDTPRGDIVPPSDYDFARVDRDFLPAPDLEALADFLIAEKPSLATLEDFTIAYHWKRQGGKSKGKVRLGSCQLTPPLVRAYRPSDWTIVLSADHVRELKLTPHQIEALLFHELSHCAVKEVDNADGGTDYLPALAPHDLEMFAAEVLEYGLWTTDLQRVAPVFQPHLPGFGGGK